MSPWPWSWKNIKSRFQRKWRLGERAEVFPSVSLIKLYTLNIAMFPGFKGIHFGLGPSIATNVMTPFPCVRSADPVDWPAFPRRLFDDSEPPACVLRQHCLLVTPTKWSCCGWTKPRTTLKAMAILCWYLQRNYHSRDFSVVQDFVHPA